MTTLQREIILYKTICEVCERDLDLIVNKYLKKGFQPYGSPYILMTDYSVEYHQAMVKYKKTCKTCNDTCKVNNPLVDGSDYYELCPDCLKKVKTECKDQ